MNRQTWKRTARENLSDLIGIARAIKTGVGGLSAEEVKVNLECLERRVRIAIDEIGREA